jgi:hypothetical protein
MAWNDDYSKRCSAGNKQPVTLATLAEQEAWVCSLISLRLEDRVWGPWLIRVVSQCLTPYGIDGTWYHSQLGKSSRSWVAIDLTFSSRRTVYYGDRNGWMVEVKLHFSHHITWSMVFMWYRPNLLYSLIDQCELHGPTIVDIGVVPSRGRI